MKDNEQNNPNDHDGARHRGGSERTVLVNTFTAIGIAATLATQFSTANAAPIMSQPSSNMSNASAEAVLGLPKIYGKDGNFPNLCSIL